VFYFIVFDFFQKAYRNSQRLLGKYQLLQKLHHDDTLRWFNPLKPWASECPDVKNYKWRLNPVWHRILYSCTPYGNSRL